LYSD